MSDGDLWNPLAGARALFESVGHAGLIGCGALCNTV